MSVQPLRLLVVDDHALFRRGLIGLLEEMTEFRVVGQASDGLEALPMIEQLKPDIVLLDVNMPRMDGIATAEAVRKRRLPVKILMLTISQHEEDLLSGIRAGVDGYLLKNAEPEELRKALLGIAEGQGALSPEVTGPVLKALAARSTLPAAQLLSDREVEVLHCLANGLTTSEISSRLFISENTVKTHVRHILEKLEASNRTEAVRKGMQLGLIQNEH